MVAHVIWTPYQRLAQLLRRDPRWNDPKRYLVVVGDVQRLRGMRIDRLYIFDPTDALDPGEVSYAYSLARQVETIFL